MSIESGLVNLILVARGLRDAYYPNNVSPEVLDQLKSYAQSTRINYLTTPLGVSVFVRGPQIAEQIKTQPDLGRALGYYCFNHVNYWDDRKSRFTVDVTETNYNIPILTEVCEGDKLDLSSIENFYWSKVNLWNKVLPLYQFKFKVEYVPSRNELLTIRDYNNYVRFKHHYLDLVCPIFRKSN
jgi:hypothetical protein